MKHALSKKTAALFSCLLLGSSAYAQQDEPYFQQYLKQAHKTSYAAKATPYVAPDPNRNGPCDLIANGDFEAQVQAPNRLNNMGGGLPNGAASESNNIVPTQVQGWWSPTGGSPDYYATNATANPFRPDLPPMAHPAFTPYGPFTPFGAAGVGLYARQEYTADKYYDPMAEYISTNITAAPGRYYAQFQLSLTGNRGAANRGIAAYGFGIQVSSGPIPGTSNSSRDFIPNANPDLWNAGPIDQSFVNSFKRVSGQFNIEPGDDTFTMGFFNRNALNAPTLTGGNTQIPSTYVFVDNVELFKIPTAGSNKGCESRSQGVTIGEGCHIPGAIYTWSASVNGGPFVINSTSTSTPILSVSPTIDTFYQLTVTLPDGGTHVTYAAVEACPCDLAPAPNVQAPNDMDGCTIFGGTFQILDYNTSYTYSVTASGSIRLFGPGFNAANGSIVVKTTSQQGDGFLTIKITNDCGTATYGQSYYVSGCGYKQSLTAYPNPAQDKVTIPAEVEQIEVVNQHGKAVIHKQRNPSQLDVSKLPDGLYILRTTHSGKTETQRLQIQH